MQVILASHQIVIPAILLQNSKTQISLKASQQKLWMFEMAVLMKICRVTKMGLIIFE